MAAPKVFRVFPSVIQSFLSNNVVDISTNWLYLPNGEVGKSIFLPFGESHQILQTVCPESIEKKQLSHYSGSVVAIENPER